MLVESEGAKKVRLSFNLMSGAEVMPFFERQIHREGFEPGSESEACFGQDEEIYRCCSVPAYIKVNGHLQSL